MKYMEDKKEDQFNEFSKYHDHIDWGNGLLNRIELLKNKWDKNSEFEFIDTIVKEWKGEF